MVQRNAHLPRSDLRMGRVAQAATDAAVSDSCENAGHVDVRVFDCPDVWLRLVRLVRALAQHCLDVGLVAVACSSTRTSLCVSARSKWQLPRSTAGWLAPDVGSTATVLQP